MVDWRGRVGAEIRCREIDAPGFQDAKNENFQFTREQPPLPTSPEKNKPKEEKNWDHLPVNFFWF